jgi:hypothetical protein
MVVAREREISGGCKEAQHSCHADSMGNLAKMKWPCLHELIQTSSGDCHSDQY